MDGWGYLALTAGLVVEGPVATFVGGTLVGSGHANLVAVWVLALVVDLVLDTALVVIGRYARVYGESGTPARLAQLLGFTPERRDRLSRNVSERPGRVVAWAKLVDVGAVPAFLAIGWAGVGLPRLLRWSVPLTALRVSILLALGLALGSSLSSRVEDLLRQPWLMALVGLGIGLLALGVKALVQRVLRRRRNGSVTGREL
ncbi:hypothetical protein ACFFKU_15615 [Kineococcus gynurae]|uniref:Membrane protein DedA with SNARE-associated domain n=1 Tax=Kineococcus gynurae TaxID=452979 RepID=A0ABV5LTA3_9ACTN